MLPLFKHQIEACSFLIEKNGCAFIKHDPGLGKTRTALETYKYLKTILPKLKLFVIAPLSLLEVAWHEDINKFTPEFTFKNLHKEFIFLILIYTPLITSLSFQRKNFRLLKNF